MTPFHVGGRPVAKRKEKPIRVDGAIAYVPLSKGHDAIIDASDVGLVEAYNWAAIPRGKTHYAMGRCEGKKRYIHRVLTEAPDGVFVDHINGNGLDNRRANLRFATASQNQHNQRISSANKSGFKGVSWAAREQKWIAVIRLNYKCHYLGGFQSPEMAHQAYCEASARLHGEYGCLS